MTTATTATIERPLTEAPPPADEAALAEGPDVDRRRSGKAKGVRAPGQHIAPGRRRFGSASALKRRSVRVWFKRWPREQ